MLKHVPNNMLFKCENGIRRVAISTLKSFLVKLDIKSATDDSSRYATILVNGMRVATYVGSYNVNTNISPINVLGAFTVDSNTGD